MKTYTEKFKELHDRLEIRILAMGIFGRTRLNDMKEIAGIVIITPDEIPYEKMKRIINLSITLDLEIDFKATELMDQSCLFLLVHQSEENENSILTKEELTQFLTQLKSEGAEVYPPTDEILDRLKKKIQNYFDKLENDMRNGSSEV